MADRRLNLAFLVAACGLWLLACGRPKPVAPPTRSAPASARPPHASPKPPQASDAPRRQPRTSRRAAPAAAPRESLESGEPAESAALPPIPDADWVTAVAPEPKIRVGISTRVDLVRLSADREFWVGDGTRWFTARDLLVELHFAPGAVRESTVYRVRVGSFLTRAAANRLVSELRKEFELPVRIDREPGTGRYRVLAGEMSTGEGAQVAAKRLQSMGYDSEEARVQEEGTHGTRPLGFKLTIPGHEPQHLDGPSMLVVPASRQAQIEVDGLRYRGFFHLFVNASNRFSLVNVVQLEDYLRGVVPGELSPVAFPEVEALKAQAVAARTYALKHMGQYESEGYDICATPACQVYKGASAEHRLSDDAVLSTAGQTLRLDGKLIDPLYTSTCGGRTENAENVFTYPHPYLVSRTCFLESTPTALTSARRRMPLSAGIANALGVLTEDAVATMSASGDDAWWERTISEDQFETWLSASLAKLGQRSCATSTDNARRVPNGRPLTWVRLADSLAAHLCWDGRLPFLLTPPDQGRFFASADSLPRSQQLRLAYGLSSGLVVPPPEGLEPSASVSRSSVLDLLVRLFEKQGLEVLESYRLSRFDGERLWLTKETDEDETDVLPQPFWISENAGLYRESESSAYAVSTVHLLPNDPIRVFRVGERVEIVSVREMGGSFDRSSQFSRWTVHRTRDVLGEELASKYGLGTILDIQPKRYGPSGRVAELELTGSSGSKMLKGLAIRRALGLRENLFFVDRRYDAKGSISHWVFTGRGWGHGVGMCQVGAYGMALAGFDHAQILTHYYQGASLTFPVDASAEHD